VLGRLLSDLKIDCNPHGFRSSFRSWCSDEDIESGAGGTSLGSCGRESGRPALCAERRAVAPTRGHGGLGHVPSRLGLAADQAADQAVGGHPVALVKFGILPPCEDAGIEADEGEPGCVVRRETEFEEGLLAAAEMGDLEGLLHGQKPMARPVRR